MKGIGFIGAGNMGEALIRGILEAKRVSPADLAVLEIRADRAREMTKRYGVTAAKDLPDLLSRCDTAVVAVKPQTVPELLRSLSPANARGKLLLSIAAGVPIRAFLDALGEKAAVARAMPNTPAQVGMGATGICFSAGVTRAQRQRAMEIFSAVGTVAEFPREELLDAVTALSGSGPAYVFLFIEALADGAVRAGMPREEALRLAAATVEGAARMVRETGVHPGELKDRVTSPGGTTAAGLAALERGAFRGTVLEAVDAAWRRCRELSR
ncbi:MAG: pyrroline-5-carboxylate reductase [Deltaproteobacteria bacterium]